MKKKLSLYLTILENADLTIGIIIILILLLNHIVLGEIGLLLSANILNMGAILELKLLFLKLLKLLKLLFL